MSFRVFLCAGKSGLLSITAVSPYTESANNKPLSNIDILASDSL